jgi:hypothetical protein
MAACAHFTHAGEDCCARGVDYMKLAGGGAFRMLLRLPCLPITNRRGEEARACAKYQAQSADDDQTDTRDH